MANASDPFDVARIIHHAITTDQPKLRYPVSWGGEAIAAARKTMTDEEWVGLGHIADDDVYYARFEAAFGLDISPAS